MASQAAPVLHHATTKRGVVWWYVRIPSRLSQARQARKFFRTEPEAIRFAASLARQGASLAGAFLKFSEREKAVILRCVARVGGVDNLERAADAFALRRPLGSKPLGGVMDELLQLKVQSGKRPRYIEALTSSFKRFCVRDKHSGRLTMPGYDALNDLLGAIDPAAYAQALTAFLQAHAGLLPRSLALDGKSVGNGRCGLIHHAVPSRRRTPRRHDGGPR